MTIESITARVLRVQSGLRTQNRTGAFNELHKLALQGHIEAYYPLGQCFYEGWVHPSNYDMALSWFQKCMIDGYIHYDQALYYMAAILFKGTERALPVITKAAQKGKQYAQFIMGIYYEHGFIEYNQEIARSWYEKSAIQGYDRAQAALGHLLLDQAIEFRVRQEPFIEIKLHEALSWLDQAGQQNNASALIRLGSLHEEGILIKKDITKAIEYYEHAIHATDTSKAMNALAYYLLGVNYKQGHIGLERDLTKAHHYLQQSSQSNYPPAHRQLALMYAEGLGVTMDRQHAHQLLGRAAQQGDIQSMIYTQKKEITLPLCEKMANKGNITAQVSLADLYHSMKNYRLALEWYQKAATNTILKVSSADPSCTLHIHFLKKRNTARLMVARYKLNGWGNATRDPQWALEELQRLSGHENSPDAQYWLAVCYQEGVSTDTFTLVSHLSTAFDLYKKSALSGHIESHHQVGYMLSTGFSSDTGLIKDIPGAYDWYLPAAKHGHKSAQYSIGMYHEYGLAPLNQVHIENAMKWYQLAAEQDYALAMISLARLVTLSDAPSSQRIAYTLLRRAADKGSTGMRELALAYENGSISDVVPEKTDQERRVAAFALLKKSASQGDAVAWHALAKYYEDEADDTKYIECLQRSEELGHSIAGLDLAEFYLRRQQIDKAIAKYTEIIDTKGKTMSRRARLGLIRLFFRHSMEDPRILDWLTEMCRSTHSETPEAMELMAELSDAIHWYTQCLSQKPENTGSPYSISHAYYAQQRSFCKLVTLYMDNKNYKDAYECMNTHMTYLTYPRYLTPEMEPQVRQLKYTMGYISLHHLKYTDEALKWLTEAADDEVGEAAFELATYYASLPGDYRNQVHFRYRQGIESNHLGCIRGLAVFLMEEDTGHGEEHETAAEIIVLLEKAIEMDDVAAYYHLGLLYENGFASNIVEPDLSLALEYYTNGAHKDDYLCMKKVAHLLDTKLAKYKEATYWFEKMVEMFNDLKGKMILFSYQLQGFLQHTRGESDILVDLLEEVERGIVLQGEKNGDSEALGIGFYLLGQCYEFGRGTVIDLQIAKKYYLQAVDVARHAEAMCRLGVLEMSKDERQSLEWFSRAAREDHSEALYYTGLFHLKGLGGLEANMSVAQRYFDKASTKGHALATLRLGHIVWRHKREFIRGYELYLSAAHFKLPAALRELGHLSHRGHTEKGTTIVKQDYQRALSYYCEAAQLGDPVSALMVGDYFEVGYMKDEQWMDRDKALQWYETAYRLNCGSVAEMAIARLKHRMAAQMSPRDAEATREEAFTWFESVANGESNNQHTLYAKIMVAFYYLKGWGCQPCEPEKAFQMLVKVAQVGICEAFKAVAKCYEYGWGVNENMSEALNYWGMAADLDDLEALTRIAEIYEFGLAGTVDRELAHTYFFRAQTIDVNNRKKNKRISLDEYSFQSSSTSAALAIKTV
ncbi:hypothetical protein BDB01DRAFT_852322 [Pilobolus umbonatus]|nr:hypothetical protein BDB01DRAFT_852322 [Pilobolus umbonatus]